MSINSISGESSNPYLSTSGKASASGDSKAEEKQLLKELEQVAASDPQAAQQLLSSLPKSEAEKLMKDLLKHDVSASKSIHEAVHQQQGQPSANATSGLTA